MVEKLTKPTITSLHLGDRRSQLVLDSTINHFRIRTYRLDYLDKKKLAVANRTKNGRQRKRNLSDTRDVLSVYGQYITFLHLLSSQPTPYLNVNGPNGLWWGYYAGKGKFQRLLHNGSLDSKNVDLSMELKRPEKIDAGESVRWTSNGMAPLTVYLLSEFPFAMSGFEFVEE